MATKKSTEFSYVHVGVAALVGVGLGYALHRLTGTQTAGAGQPQFFGSFAPSGCYLNMTYSGATSLAHRDVQFVGILPSSMLEMSGLTCDRWMALSPSEKTQTAMQFANTWTQYIRSRSSRGWDGFARPVDNDYQSWVRATNLWCRGLCVEPEQMLATTSSSIQIPKSVSSAVRVRA